MLAGKENQCLSPQRLYSKAKEKFKGIPIMRLSTEGLSPVLDLEAENAIHLSLGTFAHTEKSLHEPVRGDKQTYIHSKRGGRVQA